MNLKPTLVSFRSSLSKNHKVIYSLLDSCLFFGRAPLPPGLNQSQQQNLHRFNLPHNFNNIQKDIDPALRENVQELSNFVLPTRLYH